MCKRLDGQTAIVTGAGRGIGRAIARELANMGANIVINYATRTYPAHELANELEELGVKTLVIQADVSQYEQVEGMLRNTIETFGKIDILINNAGVTCDRTLKNMQKAHWDEVIHVNLDSLFNCTRQVIPFMIEQKRGRIVNMSSFVGQGGNIGQTNYATSKAGVIGFTKALAQEVARYGITVNAVCPGFTETDMLSAVPEEIRQRLLERIPLGRFAQAEEIAACVRYLVTEGDYITAQTLSINGGVYI